LIAVLRRARIKPAMKKRSVTLVAVVAAIAAGVWLLVGPAAAHRNAVDFHCTASAQAPAGGHASGRLVPKKPTALALCRYGPAPGYALEASRLVTKRKVVHRVASGLNALPKMPSGAIACPASDGSEIVVYAMYKRSATRIVHVALNGCLTARRRDLVRWDTPSGGKFVRVLKHLTR
jgi:hypothetical protein